MTLRYYEKALTKDMRRYLLEMKKIIIMMFGIILIVTGCSAVSMENAEQQTQKKMDDLADDDNENSDSNDNRHRTGESVILRSGSGEMTVTVKSWGRHKGIYINYEIQNTGSTEIGVDESIFGVYADNYKMDLTYGENSLIFETLAPGRKVNGTLYVNDVSYRDYKTIEVDCNGYVYLIWDNSFIDDFIGSYSWEDGDNGANITIGEDSRHFNCLEVIGECWHGNEKGKISLLSDSRHILSDFVPEYDSDTGVGHIKCGYGFEGYYLEIYKTDDGGIYVQQFGQVYSPDALDYTDVLSFAGTYHVGLVDRQQSDAGEVSDRNSLDTYNNRAVTQYESFTMADLGLDNKELNFYWEKGENEDATGADIYISYNEDRQTVSVVGIWWNSVDEEDFDCVVEEIYNDSSIKVTDGLGTTLLIQFLDEECIKVEQIEDLAETGGVFNGTYQLRQKSEETPQIIQFDSGYISSIQASSELTDSTKTYKVETVLDGNKETCWSEGAVGTGEGEFIYIEFTSPVYISEVAFLNGYMKNETVYNANGKIRRAELRFDDNSYEVEFTDWQYWEIANSLYSDRFTLDTPIRTQSLSITILDAQKGTKYDDICLTDLAIWGYADNNGS